MSITADQIRTLLRRECRKAGGGRAWAEEHGLAFSYVYDVLAQRRNPGNKLLAALGKRKAEQMYEDANA
jgi:hypothetical protein